MFDRVLQTFQSSKPAPAKKEEKKEIKVEQKSSQTTPAKKASGGLLQKIKNRFNFTEETQEEENEERKLHNEMIKALDKVKEECSKDQGSLNSKVIILKYEIKNTDLTNDDVLELVNKMQTKLKNKKKYGFMTDLTDYELFSKHVDPIVKQWKKSEKKPEVSGVKAKS